MSGESAQEVGVTGSRTVGGEAGGGGKRRVARARRGPPSPFPRSIVASTGTRAARAEKKAASGRAAWGAVLTALSGPVCVTAGVEKVAAWWGAQRWCAGGRMGGGGWGGGEPRARACGARSGPTGGAAREARPCPLFPRSRASPRRGGGPRRQHARAAGASIPHDASKDPPARRPRAGRGGECHAPGGWGGRRRAWVGGAWGYGGAAAPWRTACASHLQRG